MNRRIRPLSSMALAVAGLLAVTPAAMYAQQAPAGHDHAAHQPASPRASAATIEELINRMHASTGDAKTAVMADLIELLVKERQTCKSMMMDGKMMPPPAVATPGTPSQ